MKIIVDAMGGDNAPQATVEGALACPEGPGGGDPPGGPGGGHPDRLPGQAGRPGPARRAWRSPTASQVVEMADNPATAFKEKKDSSLTVGLNLLKEGTGDAFVSAGSARGPCSRLPP